MKINFLKINGFGKLSHQEINLDDNINLITGNNESGKTTLFKFITSMLYGISKNKNGQEITDYEKYTPWNNSEFSGKMIYTLDSNEKIEVFRDFNKKNPKIYNENSEEISKNFKIDKTKGNEFFYEQTNLDEDTFLSTSLVEQQAVVLDKQEKNILIQKIANILTTGEDNLSYKKSIEKLNKKLTEEIGTERTNGRPLNIILEKIKKIKEEKELLKNDEEKIKKIKEKNNYLINLIDEKYKENNLLNEIKKIKEKINIEKEKINLKNNIIEDYEEKIINIKNNKTEKNNKKIFILIPIYFLLILINLILFLKNIKIKKIILIISCLIFLVNLIYILLKIKKEKNKIKNDEKEINILEENKTEKINEIKNDEKNIEKIIKEEKNNLLQKYNLISEDAIDKLLKKELIFIEEDIENCILNINNLRVEYGTNENEEKIIESNLENKAALDEELENLNNEYEEIIEKQKLIKLTKEVLENSYNSIKEEMMPKFTKSISTAASKISDGKYKNVKFNEEGLSIENENGEYIGVNNLSIGTIDQLYLSLRLSIAKEITKEKIPIILDESFAYYDQDRLKNILNYLNKNFNDHQIIIFSCTNREKEILQELNVKYNLVEI